MRHHMDKWQVGYSSGDYVRITTRDGKSLPWDEFHVWVARDDKDPSVIRPDKTERPSFVLPITHLTLPKGSVITIDMVDMKFVGDAVVLCDVPFYTHGLSPWYVQLEWVR